MPVVLSIVMPAFNEIAKLDALYERVVRSMQKVGMDWEWLIVDDDSRDEAFGVIERMSVSDNRVRRLRLARNSGLHAAIAHGLHHAAGDAAVVLAADL
jgi:glycosyltransferase involved in cell wall biosynthesis